jgi:hypothetical protein
MRIALSVLVIAVATTLGACDGNRDVASGPHRGGGRYLGVGIYPADQLWSQFAEKDADKDASRALRADDGQIIVVVDSRTGEIRQCGNLSGYCVTMNPWSAPLGADRSAPVSLSKHASDIANESAAEASQSNVIAN